ncbi:MAG: ribosomal-processing cysteine protease Prp [Acutalibacteraceae bacterium]|nr:ribosomal-processing cysteine protease Prp [Clostridia bacterium]MEE3403895.1 ribosomal-processing cysteine protease Prp [Acutalibacteraceae bacterium]HCA54731.1 ribosomal-processing cysteine protease Prp [Oscillospiraceae bacterium]
MIKAEFFVTSRQQMVGFHIHGHAGYAAAGEDVICAFVSSAAYMTANTLTEIMGIPAEACAEDGDMLVRINEKDAGRCRELLEGLRLHLLNTEEQYPHYVKVIITEV